MIETMPTHKIACRQVFIHACVNKMPNYSHSVPEGLVRRGVAACKEVQSQGCIELQLHNLRAILLIAGTLIVHANGLGNEGAHD